MTSNVNYHVLDSDANEHESATAIGKQDKFRKQPDTDEADSLSHSISDWWSRLVADQWVLELLAAFISLAAIGSVIGVLSAYDGKPVPPLARGITLNAIISLLATISRTSIMLCAGSALSQCKWLWYENKTKKRGKKRNLQDLQSIENASRGPLGSILLLFSRRGGFTIYLAAIVTIGALGFDPFVQQLFTTNERPVALLASGIHISATNNITVNMEEVFDSPQAETQLTAAAVANMQKDPQPVYVFGGRKRSTSQISRMNIVSQPSTSSLRATCPSDNCVWPNYYTLDICTRCEDVLATTALKSLSPGAVNLTGIIANFTAGKHDGGTTTKPSFIWEVAPKNGDSVVFRSNVSAFVSASDIKTGGPTEIQYSGDLLHKLVWILNGVNFDSIYLDGTNWTSQAFAGIDGPAVALGYAEFALDGQAGIPVLNKSLECALTYCVNEYNRSVVEGNLVSNVLSTHYGNTTRRPGSNKYVNMTWATTVGGNAFTVESLRYGAGIDKITQLVSGQSNYTFTGKCLSENDWKCKGPPMAAHGYSSIQWSGIDLTDDFSTLLENTRLVMSGMLQQYGPVSIVGQNFVFKPFVIVRWPWLAYPLTMIILGIVALGLTIWRTKRHKVPLWKASLFPLIYRYEHDNENERESGNEHQYDNEDFSARKQHSQELREMSTRYHGSTTAATTATDLVSQFEMQAEATPATLSRDVSEQRLWKLRTT